MKLRIKINTKNISILKELQSKAMFSQQCLLYVLHIIQDKVQLIIFFKITPFLSPYICVQQYALPNLYCNSITKHDIPFANTEKDYCQITFNSAFANLNFSTTLRLYFAKPKVQVGSPPKQNSSRITQLDVQKDIKSKQTYKMTSEKFIEVPTRALLGLFLTIIFVFNLLLQKCWTLH